LRELARMQALGLRPQAAGCLFRHALRSAPRRAGAARAMGAVEELVASGRGKRDVQLVEGDRLHSTTEDRVVVWGGTLAMAGTVLGGALQCATALDCCAAAAALGAAYVLADLGTGIYHFGVDNYGDANTPVFGRQIEAFQGHHRRPWTITEREFENNVMLVFKPMLPFAAVFLLGTPFLPPFVSVWAGSFMWLICMSQQFHAWAHMRKSELNPAIVWLQDHGVLVSRKAHGAHHKAPFDGNYCIVSGFWNPILDKDGADDSFFRTLERFIYKTTGQKPRCWDLPTDWHEEPYFKPESQ